MFFVCVVAFSPFIKKSGMKQIVVLIVWPSDMLKEGLSM